jgi:subfamily B ATP-binding cassette protein MsbA
MLNVPKQLIFFWRLSGWRFALYVAVRLFSGITDAVGLSLMVPLIESIINPDSGARGATRIVRDVFALVGVAPTIRILVTTIVIVFLIKAVFVLAANLLRQRIVTGMEEDLRLTIIRGMQHIEYDALARFDRGKFNNTMTTEVTNTVSGFKALAALIAGSAQVAIYAAGALLANWRVSLLGIAVGAMAFVVFRGLARRIHALSFDVMDRNARSQSLAVQVLAHIKYLKATGAIASMADRLGIEINRRRSAVLRLERNRAIASSLLEPFAVAAVMGFLLFTAEVMAEPLSSALIPLLFLYRILGGTNELQRNWQTVLVNAGAIHAVSTLVADLERGLETQGGATVPPLARAIELRNLRVVRDDKAILHDVTLSIPTPGLVGLVGPTGAGKTTLVDIVCALIRPQAGTITWDGTLYGDLDRAKLRARFGYVTQDPAIFGDSLFRNIALDAPDDPETRRRVAEAAHLAQCDDFISDREGGLDALIGDQGGKLSGGQRQRLAIAREIFRNPDVLIVDEGTSALDAESEAKIRATIESLSRSRAVLVIAHRLSTLRHCARIYALDAGRVVASGSWEELTRESDGWFAKMIRLQAVSGAP